MQRKRKSDVQKNQATTLPTEERKKIDRLAFIDALSKVKPGLASKEIIEQSTHFIFDNDRIWTYNDQIYISHPFTTGISGAIKAEQFYKLLDKLEDDELSIEYEINKVSIIGARVKAEIRIDPDLKIVPVPVPNISKQWENLPENFVRGIAFTSFSTSQNMNRPELTCLFISNGYIIGCDTFRGSKYKLSSKMKKTFLLPAAAATQLGKYNPIRMISDDGWLHFSNEQGTMFSCRTYQIEYPETIWEFFSVEGQQITLPQKFIDVVDRAQVLVTVDFDLDKIVKLTIAPDEIVCESTGDYGNFKERVQVQNQYNGEPLIINIHPVLLKEILRYLQVVVIGPRLLFKGDDFDHCICLSC